MVFESVVKKTRVGLFPHPLAFIFKIAFLFFDMTNKQFAQINTPFRV